MVNAHPVNRLAPSRTEKAVTHLDTSLGEERKSIKIRRKIPLHKLKKNWPNVSHVSQLSNSRTVFLLFTTRKRVWSLIFDKTSVSSEMVKLAINAKPKTKVRKNDIETFYCLWCSSVRPSFFCLKTGSRNKPLQHVHWLCFSRWRQSLRVCLWGCWFVRASPLSLLHAPPHQAGKDGHHHFGVDFYQVLW